MPFKITAIIVDDERPAREEMKYLLSDHGDIDVVGICSSPTEAKTLIEKFKPMVAFLDITMPGEDAFEMLADMRFIPLVVFVTAHHEHALKAFDHSAIDYLLKPVNPDRLARTLQKIRSLLNGNTQLPKHLFLKDGNNYHVVDYTAIDAIESYGNYVKIHHNNQVIVQPFTLREIASWLDQTIFMQISRHAIVNLHRVSAIKQQGRQLYLVMGALQFVCAVRKASKLKERLKGMNN
jgi:two-component system, LytTR family, response regulator